MKNLLVFAVFFFIAFPAYAQTTLGTSSSATSPQRSGDATTGLFSATSGTVALSSGGSEVMRVTATGVGIGTATPGRLLTVYGSGGEVIGDGTSGLLVQGDISGVAEVTGINAANNSFNDVVFNAATQNILYLKSSNGNVGIGTSTPSFMLDVRGSAGSTLGSNGLPVINKINVVTFTSSGTYTPTTGLGYALIEVIGGGGGGAGAPAPAAGAGSGGGGGGGGAYARGIKTAATIGSSQTVTVGAGGAAGASSGSQNGGSGGSSSAGTLISAGGGSGGVQLNTSCNTVCQTGTPGSGGSAGGTFDYGAPGQSGSYGMAISGWQAAIGGAGGTSGEGSSGGATAMPGSGSGTATTGKSPSDYGGGGGGGATSAGGAIGGGAGAPGIVVITEYISD